MYKSKNGIGIRDITTISKNATCQEGNAFLIPPPAPSSSRRSQMTGHTHLQKSMSVYGHPVFRRHRQIALLPQQTHHHAGRTSAQIAFAPSPVGSHPSPRIGFPRSFVRPRLPPRRIYGGRSREGQVFQKTELARTLPSSLLTVRQDLERLRS